MREALGPTPRYVPVGTRRKRVTKYFNAGNNVSIALSCDVKPIKSSVPKQKVKAVSKRDSGRCIVCGGKKSLVVDHIQALKNGGSNSFDNLAILCRECRKLKSNHDKSLTLRRQKLCAK